MLIQEWYTAWLKVITAFFLLKLLYLKYRNTEFKTQILRRFQNRDDDVFLCITGQKGRLHINNKIESIIYPYQALGRNVHVGIVLQNNFESRFTNSHRFQLNVVVPTFNSTNVIYNEFKKRGVIVDISLVNIRFSNDFARAFTRHVERLDKKWMTVNKRIKRAEHHFSQFVTMSKCADIFEKKQSEGFNFQNGVVIKTRDDAITYLNVSQFLSVPSNSVEMCSEAR